MATDYYRGRFAAAGDPGFLHAIRAAGREQRFTRGENLPVAGPLHPQGPVLMIETGFVSTIAIAESGQSTLLAIHGPGDLVGEHALFGATTEAHGLSVTGMSKGSAWRVSQDRFRQVLHDHPQGWEVLARHLHGRVAAAEKRICLMAGETASRRLAVFLLQLLSYAEPTQPGGAQARLVPLPLSQAELAGWIGVTRETVERVLGGWVREGTVRTGRRYLLVRDVSRLKQLAVSRHDDTARAA
jgi:CRP/FNR family cyclic AMP-dependent transcriptional regulator